MTTKNKISFAMFIVGVLLIALAAIGSFKIGLDAVVSSAMYSIAAALIDVALILWLGISRYLRCFYLMLVLGIVILCVVFIVASEDIVVWISAGVVAVVAVASLIPVVFKGSQY